VNAHCVCVRVARAEGTRCGGAVACAGAHGAKRPSRSKNSSHTGTKCQNSYHNCWEPLHSHVITVHFRNSSSSRFLSESLHKIPSISLRMIHVQLWLRNASTAMPLASLVQCPHSAFSSERFIPVPRSRYRSTTRHLLATSCCPAPPLAIRPEGECWGM